MRAQNTPQPPWVGVRDAVLSEMENEQFSAACAGPGACPGQPRGWRIGAVFKPGGGVKALGGVGLGAGGGVPTG